jgi:hypothetical protein
MLSFDDNVVLNVRDNSNKCKRDDEASSKLCHCRLGHVWKGRMECLIREGILQPLDFSNSEECNNCIEGAYTKTIKNGATRSSGILELIHTDICGPFSITSVDGFDSLLEILL